MAFSSLRPFLPRPLPPRIPTLRSELSLYISSSLPPPRPHCRRKNHLRPKILNSPLPPSPHPPPPPPPPPSPSPPLHEPFEPSYPTGSSLLFVEEGEAEEETFVACEVSDAFPPGTPYRWFPGSVLYLASRFAALLVVQTAAAVWLLSREDAKEVGGSNEDGFKENEKVKESGKGIEVDDFDRMVVEIREMAREVREREAEGIAGDGGVKEEVSKRVGRGRKSISMLVMDGNEDGLVVKKDKRRLKLRSRGVGYLPKAKGFGGSKPIRSESDLGKEVLKMAIKDSP